MLRLREDAHIYKCKAAPQSEDKTHRGYIKVTAQLRLGGFRKKLLVKGRTDVTFDIIKKVENQTSMTKVLTMEIF